ncbi:hypothetical protein JNB71_03465 [Rhizobium herbae]|uniref:DUF2163 domain-containing protein n=1 Tax=Rhizobium herbae TaxID=508661 RepID=A0ABS7H6I3_9HYPH|nr:hypothetical protein [Rhizobium herbae]MBW9062370.1 hypothetical protein [Rhizobium herbae]
MRDVDSAFLTALQNARERGIVPRKLISITGRDFETGDPALVSFWSGHEDVTMTVVSGISGATSSRLFVGSVNLTVSPIPRVADLTIQTVTVSVSQIAEPIQALVRGLDVRLAKVEIWEALLDPTSRQLVSTPPLVFLGEVDGSPITTPEVGGEGSVEISVVSDAISMLTRKNPQKSSYEAQKLRSPNPADPDQFGKYAASIRSWSIPWGVKD